MKYNLNQYIAIKYEKLKTEGVEAVCGKMCRRLSCRGTGWSRGALRLAVVCLWGVIRINWLF